METAQKQFTHATALIIHSWSALDIAVQNEWAGPESSNIRDWLGGVIVDMFSFPPGKTVEAEDIEEVLLQIVEDEFELRLEDDSAYQVASDIVKSYELCVQGDFQHITVLEEMYQKLKRQPRNDKALSPPPQEVDDDEDEEVEINNKTGEAMQVETSNQNDGPIIDEDGFQLVQGKGRRKGR